MRGDRLEVGQRGEIGYRIDGDRILASVYFRDHFGKRRRVAGRGDSKAAARRKVLDLYDQAIEAGGSGAYSVRTTFAEVAKEWHQQIVDLVDIGRRSPATSALYRHALDRHVLPELGGLLLREVTTARLDRFILRLRAERGYSVAKLCRSIVSGVCGLAVRRDAMRSNPVRDGGPVGRRAA